MDTNAGSSSVEILQQYKLGRNLGIGSFGKVRLAQHANGQEVAIKIIERQNLNGVDLERVLQEIKILRLLEHPHIVRLYNAVETQTKFYILMEYVKGGELYDYVSDNVRIEEAEARRIFQQIISGIEFCHLNRVAHRDLKMENVLLDSERNVKIIDFGLSNIMQDGHFFKTFCGSPDYAAPEILSGKLYAGPEVDVWSCGVILYALLCQRLPFEADNLPLLYRKIKSGKFVQPISLSDAAMDLIHKILVVDPIKRLTIPEIRQHPWFRDHHVLHSQVTDTTPWVEKHSSIDTNTLIRRTNASNSTTAD
ncbi:SNF1-related protein kinase catalytic subunit alpha kin10 [Asimina triloba]